MKKVPSGGRGIIFFGLCPCVWRRLPDENKVAQKEQDGKEINAV
jgi:hypothetical protein